MSHFTKDLFGNLIPSQAVHQVRVRKIGYAARPGSGPKSQRCFTCINCQAVLSKGIRSHKCEAMAPIWSNDPATDIKRFAPACSEWQQRPFVRKAA